MMAQKDTSTRFFFFQNGRILRPNFAKIGVWLGRAENLLIESPSHVGWLKKTRRRVFFDQNGRLLGPNLAKNGPWMGRAENFLIESLTYSELLPINHTTELLNQPSYLFSILVLLLTIFHSNHSHS